jgi:hypothetical protein
VPEPDARQGVRLRIDPASPRSLAQGTEIVVRDADDALDLLAGSYSSAVNWLQQALGELAPDRRNSERWCCSIWLLPTRRRTLSTPRR